MDKDDIESYKYDAIKQINKYRNRHGAKPLTNDPKIDKIAQDFADKLSITGNLDYSYNKYRGRDLGESVYESEGYIAPLKLIKTFYDENFGYNYNDKNPEPSNFTQMVWQSSHLIGFGMQKASNNKYYFVLNYYPTGNVDGLFKQNVLPFPMNSFEETKTFEISNNKKEPSLKTIYKKREISNGRSHVEIIIKNNNEKKVTFYERDDKSPFHFKRNNYNDLDSFNHENKDTSESFFKNIYSRKNSFSNKDTDTEKVNHNSSMKDIKNNNFNNYKKGAISTININNNYNNNHRDSVIREYIRQSLKRVNIDESIKDNIRKSINRSGIRKSTKKDYLRKSTKKDCLRKSTKKDYLRKSTKKDYLRKSTKKDYLRKSTKRDKIRKSIKKDINRKSINKSFLRKSTNKKEYDMSQSSTNKSFISKPTINKIYQKRDTKRYCNNNNNNNSAINRDYKKKASFLNKNNQKSSAININFTKNDPLFDISNYSQNNHNASQTGSNFYLRKPTKRLDIDNLLSEKKNLNNNFIRKKEPENQNKNRKSTRRDLNNNTKRSNYTNTHHSAPKYESSSPEYDNFCNEALQAHNNYRKIHHAEPLKLNRELCKIAQNYADHLANIGRLQHSDNCYHNDAMGENLYCCLGKEPTGSSVTTSWYSEIKQYDYSGDWSNGTGHFTQVVWKETTEVGFGKTKAQSGKIFVVANYYPAGNVLGFFKYNVLRP
jgi:uncharacterized protein YkwD